MNDNDWLLMKACDPISDGEGLFAKKLEELAYQASDKIYGKEDNGPYECLRWVLRTAVSLLNVKVTKLQVMNH